MINDITLGGTFTINRRPMVSGIPSADQEWKIAVGKSGRIWLYHPDRSAVWVSGGPQSRGYGGSTVAFKLADGLGIIQLVGPWHSNSDSFFKDTGIDVREQHVTWGCIGTGRDYDTNTDSMRITGVLWFDSEPTKGLYERVDLLAWEMQQATPDRPLFLYTESEGGSHCGSVSKPLSLRIRDGEQDPFEDE